MLFHRMALAAGSGCGIFHEPNTKIPGPPLERLAGSHYTGKARFFPVPSFFQKLT
jgi:cytochrome c551/c552